MTTCRAGASAGPGAVAVRVGKACGDLVCAGNAYWFSAPGQHPLLCVGFCLVERVVVPFHAEEPDETAPVPGVRLLACLVVMHERDGVGHRLPGLSLGPVDDLEDVGTGDVVGQDP